MSSTRILSLTLAAATFVAAFGVAEAFDRRIRIKNDTGQDIVALSASSAESGWSGQVLGSLAAGKAAMATIDDGSGACVYDFTAQLADGSTASSPGINVCDLSVFAIQ
jgi:hypothetical protein